MKKIIISFLTTLCVLTIFMGVAKLGNLNQTNVMASSTEVEDTFKMEDGAAFRVYWSTPNCGITFSATISNSLLSNVTPKLLIVPYDYLQAIETSGTIKAKTMLEYGDYIGALEEAKKSYVMVDNVYELDNGDGTSYLSGGIKKIIDNNVNRKFFGVFYYERGYSRVYADITDNLSLNNARSMAYVSSAGYYELATKSAMAEEMTIHFMDKALVNSVKRYDTANGKNFLDTISLDSLSYKSTATNDISTSTPNVEEALVGKRRGSTVLVNTADEGLQHFTASYYDDLLTYDLRLYYYKKDGGQTSLIVTDYLDFKLNLTVNNAAKNYIEVANNGFINVLGVTGAQITNGIKVTIGKDTTNRHLTLSAFDFTANSDLVDIAVDTQYYENFSVQPSLYKPMVNVTIKPNGDKILFSKTYEAIPEFTNNGESANNTSTGSTATVTINGDGTNSTNSVSTNFKILNEIYRKYEMRIHHVSSNGVKLADDTVIYFDSQEAVTYGNKKGIIYDETLQVGGKTVKKIIADICGGTNNLSTKYLPNREWIEGLITGDMEIDVIYSEYDTWDGTAASGYASGNGTKENPYIIATAEQLAYMYEVSYNKDYGAGLYFELANSLDLSAHYWKPICFDKTNNLQWKFFRGNFNGNGYTIKYVAEAGKDGTGNTVGYALFMASHSATFRNLTIMGSSTALHRTASLTYVARNIVIDNVKNFATITNTGNAGNSLIYTGGIIGGGSEKVVITNTENYGDVTGNYGLVGGIGGEIYSLGTIIENTHNYGDIKGGFYVGGIVGRMTQDVLNCTNFGDISISGGYTKTEDIKITDTDADGNEIIVGVAGVDFGGILGRGNGSTTNHCINYGNVTALDGVGGINGYANRAFVLNSQNYGVVTAGGGYTNVGSLTGRVQDTNENGVHDEYIIKFKFVDRNGNVLLDYKDLSVLKGDVYGRTTDVGINLDDPEDVVKDMAGISYEKDDGGNDTTVVNRGPIEALVKLANYHINKKYGKTYLPDRYWATDVVESSKIEYFTFTEADVWDGNVASSYAGGTGSATNPYLISTGAQLAKLAKDAHSGYKFHQDLLSDKHYKLTRSIDLNGISWTPIGYNYSNVSKTEWQKAYDAITDTSSDYYGKTASNWNGSGSNLYTWFKGVFDGDGYTVGGLNFSNTTGTSAGLFGAVAGTIKNLNVQGVVTAAHRAGGIAYYLKGSNNSVANCRSFVDVSTTYNAGISASLVATVETSAKILDCESYGNVTNSASDSIKLGGLVGSIASSSLIVNCLNAGNVSGGKELGGIVGTTANTKVYNCVNFGNVTGVGGNCVGGIVGNCTTNSVVANGTNYGNIKGSGTQVGGVIGYIGAGGCYRDAVNNGTVTASSTTVTNKVVGWDNGSSTGGDPQNYFVYIINYWFEDGTMAATPVRLTTTSGFVARENTISPTIEGYLPNKFWCVDLITQDTVVDVYYYKADVWDGTSIASSFAGGDGTKNNPFLIETAAQFLYLKKLCEGPTENYFGNQYFKLVNSIDLNNVDWEPIGYVGGDNYGWKWFEGHLDGNGRSIANLNVNRADKFGVGLFTAISGSVKNLVLEGTVTSLHRAGALAYYGGNNTRGEANFSNITSFVDVTVSSDTATNYTGGILGTIHRATLSHVYNYGNINAKRQYVGGITGSANYATISYAYNYGGVKATGSSVTDVGGIVGYAIAITIDYGFNYGAIQGVNYVGGVVGRVQVDSAAGINSSVNNCKNYSAVNGAIYVGGVVGQISGFYNEDGKWGTGEIIPKAYNCYNQGNVTASDSKVGGVVGDTSCARVDTCTNKGHITDANGKIGGVVGYCTNGTFLYKCHNEGNVKATAGVNSEVGAICGYLGGAMTNEGNQTSLAQGCTTNAVTIDRSGYAQNSLAKLVAAKNNSGVQVVVVGYCRTSLSQWS